MVVEHACCQLKFLVAGLEKHGSLVENIPNKQELWVQSLYLVVGAVYLVVEADNIHSNKLLVF
jgi:hypothetical protein